MQILKESGRSQGREVRGQKHIRLIAIDYHAATGTAGTGSRGDQRRSTRYGVKTDSGGPCQKTQRGRGEENIEVILVLRNMSTGCRLLNTTEAK